MDNQELRFRTFNSRPASFFWQAVLFLIPVSGILYILGIHQYLRITLYKEQYVGFFLALLLSAVFIGVPAGKNAVKDRIPWYDMIMAVLGLIVGFYVVIYYPDIILTFGYVTTERIILSVIAILLVMEAIRRTVGLALMIVVLAFMLYGFFAPSFPGVLKGSETSLSQLFNYLYLDPNSLFNLLAIASTIALSFILFGQILLRFGGGDILNNFALAAFGRFRGGPAKASVLGSSLVGTITGGPVTNVMLTGNVTIPLMKKNGYTSAQAGAVEAVASTGGQIMPPVMGIAAFIIAETLGIPYSEVALAALVPAVLYYICTFAQVDLIAARSNTRRMSASELPSMRKVFRTGWVIIPAFVVLIYTLFFKGYTPSISGLYASLFGLVFLLIQRDVRTKVLKNIYNVFLDTGKTLIDIGVVLAAAGLVVGITGITGLGFNLAMMLSEVAQNGLFILLVVSAIVSVILGMGMPSVAAYTLVAVLVAPAIVEHGVEPIAAHLFVFYFSIISNFTPPVALACFAAAPIAKESPHKIGFQAMRLGLVAYLIPFMFVYSPSLLLKVVDGNSVTNVAITIITAIIACILLAFAVEGYIFSAISMIKRFIVGILGICLMIPISAFSLSWLLNTIALVLTVVFLMLEWRLNKNKGKDGEDLNNPNLSLTD
ncbi:TRAP transporter permease [Bacillus sp. Marseille-P3661]|uniref:TRAP transporter permease n=1 Tax=Bacillus sp. Marseille-P3661 TaxID=1936234 RepID=UPI000C82F9EC|nr:TRAP transporter fused permease subunit [Bacillus sp. Marseille-P3661]